MSNAYQIPILPDLYNNYITMLQRIISSKIEKSKQNIETYLSNGGTVQPQPQVLVPPKEQPAVQPIARMPTQPSAPAITPAPNKSKPVKNEVELRMISVFGKQITKDGMLFRFNKEENRFEFCFEDEGIKNRIEGKRDAITGKRVKVNYVDGACSFQLKASLLKKEDQKETSLKAKQLSEHTVVIWLKDKDQLKLLVETPFMEGLLEPPAPSTYTEAPKPAEPQPIEEAGEGEEDHGQVKLTLPTAAQQGEVDKIRKTIKEMKEEDKITVLMEVFKIKKEFEDPNNTRKLKCPVHFCIYCEKKSYKDLQQLKNHLKVKHPELSKHGIELSEYDGTFEYGSKALDLALFIGKMYPTEMKKIIKQMKTKTLE